jgi:hypothetical protein
VRVAGCPELKDPVQYHKPTPIPGVMFLESTANCKTNEKLRVRRTTAGVNIHHSLATLPALSRNTEECRPNNIRHENEIVSYHKRTHCNGNLEGRNWF